jgi:hypothetical protein
MTAYSSFHPVSYQFRPTQPEIATTLQFPNAVLTIDLPRQQYKTVKTVMVPFDPRVSNGGKFNTMHDAMKFISKHCLVHHKLFNRSLAKMYLQRCRILNFMKGGYTLPTTISKRDFDREFNAVARSLPPGR